MNEYERIEDLENQYAGEECDYKAFRIHRLINRSKRHVDFVENILPILEKSVEVVERPNGSFTFKHPNLGIIDFYPKSGKALIRKDNKWNANGLKFVKSATKEQS